MENKAKGTPPAIENKIISYTSAVWAKYAFEYQKIDGIVNKKIVVCGQCKVNLRKTLGLQT